MRKDRCALTIAGLDPGGGAGIAADLRAFSRAGIFGAAALSLVTVQSTSGLVRVEPLPVDLMREQAERVLRDQHVTAMKTGALGTTEHVLAAVDIARAHPNVALVVDPVMVATQGDAPLLAQQAIESLWTLARAATIVTPNRDEAEALLGCSIDSIDDVRAASIALVGRGLRAALVKGGHLASGPTVVDFLTFRQNQRLVTVAFEKPHRRALRLHGGGCTLSALIAGALAKRSASIRNAVAFAEDVLANAIGRAVWVGGDLQVLVP